MSSEVRTEVLGEREFTEFLGFRLTVLDGPERGREVESTGDRLVVGTAAGSTLQLTDRTVSRFHCELVVVDDHVVVRDLQSSNGTIINDVRVREAVLRDGTTLVLGRTRIAFALGGQRNRTHLTPESKLGLMVGRSPTMRAVFAMLKQAAQSNTTVLLAGETGSGKDCAAETLHQESARRDGPFVVVDCGAIPAGLLESELFGHERGAFTGARDDRPGAFELASGGTIFLDEIGELPIELQPKLLRAVERHQVKRVGSDAYHTVDVRVVAATNRDLRAEVNAGRFRSDLFYRLAVVEVRIPPLRERLSDLPILVDHFWSQLDPGDRARAQQLDKDALLVDLQRHSWPGNVRELRNYLDRCIALETRPPLTADMKHATPTIHPDIDTPFQRYRARWLEQIESNYLSAILERHDGNVSAAARAAGLARGHFYRLMSQYRLR